jgi:hypothetical protein
MSADELAELQRESLDELNLWPYALEPLKEEQFFRLQGASGAQQQPRGLTR